VDYGPALLLAGVIFLGAAILYTINQRQTTLKTANKTRQQIWQEHIDSKEWQELRKQCFELFNWRCAWCNSPLNLEAHHRTYTHLGHEVVSDHGRVGDLICLCKDCHGRAPRSNGLDRD